MTDGKKSSRESELEEAIEKIREATWKTGQTLPDLRHAIAVILQDVVQIKDKPWDRAVRVTITAPRCI